MASRAAFYFAPSTIMPSFSFYSDSLKYSQVAITRGTYVCHLSLPQVCAVQRVGKESRQTWLVCTRALPHTVASE